MHHYKKHKKRRTKDPTKFKVIVNNVGDMLEFDGDLSHGDPIKLVAQFKVPSQEERDAKIEAIRMQLENFGSKSPNSQNDSSIVETVLDQEE